MAAYHTLKPLENQPIDCGRTSDVLLTGNDLIPYFDGLENHPEYRFENSFPFRLTRSMAEKLGSLGTESLMRQFVPRREEANPTPGFSEDPLREAAASSYPGVIEKFCGRVLLYTTALCAVHCRFCFRRHFHPAVANAGQSHWTGLLAALNQRTDLNEVILSGGDPLMLGCGLFESTVQGLANLPWLETLRIHTRVPLVMPTQAAKHLSAFRAIQRRKKNVVMVVHSNHPDELNDDNLNLLNNLRQEGVTLLVQSVMLRGVNDCPSVLSSLYRNLFAVGVLPYYLHQLDPVAGAAHFAVPDHQALTIHEELRRLLPGYLVPRLVRETPNSPYKQLINMQDSAINS